MHANKDHTAAYLEDICSHIKVAFCLPRFYKNICRGADADIGDALIDSIHVSSSKSSNN